MPSSTHAISNTKIAKSPSIANPAADLGRERLADPFDRSVDRLLAEQFVEWLETQPESEAHLVLTERRARVAVEQRDAAQERSGIGPHDALDLRGCHVARHDNGQVTLNDRQVVQAPNLHR